MKRLIAASLCTAALLTSVSAKEITVGVVMPMSGPIGGFGQSAYKGIKLINEMRPTLNNGDSVKIALIDNKSDKIEAANGMQKLISSEGATAVIGALTSTNTMAITKIADENKTPLIAPVATNVLVTKGRDYVSRVCFNDSFQGVVASDYIYDTLKAKKVVVITDVKNDYSIGITKVFKRAFKNKGGEIVSNPRISQGDTDFKAMLSTIKNENPDVIFFPIYSSEAALIAKQAKQLGITTPFMGTDGMAADDVFFSAGGDSVEGFIGTALYSADAPKTNDLAKEFAKKYHEIYNESVHPFAALSADSYNLIIDSMNKCQDPADSVCVNKNIRDTKNYEGVSGNISLDKNGDAIRSAVINKVVDGKLKFSDTVTPK